MKNWLSKIPRFRSGVWWRSALAILGYALALLLLMTSSAQNPTDRFIDFIQKLVFLIGAFFLLGDVTSSNPKLPIMKSGRRFVGVIVYGLAFIIAFSGFISFTDGFKSDEYKAMMIEKRSNAESKNQSGVDNLETKSSPVPTQPPVPVQSADTNLDSKNTEPKTSEVNESKTPQPEIQQDFQKVTVTKSIDGDTVDVKFDDGKEERVRFIGVNTPESTTKHEPFGKEAAAYTKEKLEGKTVYLEKDISETDKYGRLLRYIWLELPSNLSEAEIKSKMFNAILVADGYAQVATYPPDVKYQDFFVKLQREAQEGNKGLWGIEIESNNPISSGSGNDAVNVNNNSTSNQGSAPTASTNENNSRTVYWTPSGKSYHYTKSCPTLSRSKTILEGPLDECPKSDPCDKCVR